MHLYDLLLYLYPASFRSEYGTEMRHIFTQRRQMASFPVAWIGLWVSTFLEILFNAASVHWDVLRQDLRYTARGLVRSPGFALTAIVVIALGIGANTAVFSITDQVFIRPLPFPDSQRLVQLWENTPDSARSEVSPPNYRDWQRMSSSFESMGAYVGSSGTLLGRGYPRRLGGAAVTTGVFAALSVEPLLGRSFVADDERANAPGVVVLSHGFWQAEFGGDPKVLGMSLRFDDATYTVIGVMPSSFYFPTRNALFWRPLSYSTTTDLNRGNNFLNVVARLKVTITTDQARAEMSVIADQIEHAYPHDNENSDVTFASLASSLRDDVPAQARLLIAALFGASLCVLLIACTNLASLMLTRAVARQKELTVRAAMGAGRERLVRQLLTESLMVAVLGGVAGVFVAIGSVPLLAALAPADVPFGQPTVLDTRVLVFAALLTTLAGMAFGIVPALRSCSAAKLAALRTKSGISVRREWLRSVLVAAQVAASIVLLISSSLLIRALWRIQAIDPGFRIENVVTVNTSLAAPRYADVTRKLEFYSRVLPEVRALPGVASAAFISVLPIVTGGGIQPVNGVDDDGASLRFVSPDFFASMGIPIRQGRDVTERDTLDTPLVALVSESFVRRHVAGGDPIGQAFSFSGGIRTIVGVVGNIRVRGLERDSEPQVYLPYSQMPVRVGLLYSPKELVVRSSIPIAGLIPVIRQIVQRADPDMLLQVRTFQEIIAAQTETRVVHASVLGAFAGLSLLLAGVGVHGLLSFGVSQRLPEIGLRAALGATTADILRMILRQGLLLTSVGCCLGLVLGWAAGWWIRALLAGVDPIDLPSILSAAGLALLMTATGTLFPALRAIRVDPATVMRME
jgi:predicted permease